MKFSLHIGSEISLEKFSLSQLIQMIGKLFVEEGMPGLVKAFLSVIESLLVQGGVKCPHCGSCKAHGHTKQERKLYTSLGVMVFSMRRFRCQVCKKTFVPLKSLLDVDQYSRKSREYEKLALQHMTEESFRRSSRQLENTLGFKTPHTTLHGWFMKTPATCMSVNHWVESIIADGTGYKMSWDSRRKVKWSHSEPGPKPLGKISEST
jgi:transposase-like protein